jgi:L-rhamnose-H+ transport protein
MSHIMLVALFYSVIAGVMNGSFALPTKHIKTWQFEHIWLNYAFWAFLILPWLTVFALYPQVWQIYKMMSPETALVLLVGGFSFGAGQVCFALALNSIGLGLGFILNIGLGTALGFLLPLLTLHADKLFSPAGITSIAGIFLIIISLLVSYRAGSQRDKEKLSTQTASQQTLKKTAYSLGVLLAILAGVFSAGQNYTFALTGHMQQVALSSGADSLVASVIIWPPFLTCGFIPYALYMLYLHRKNNSFKAYGESHFLKNSIFGIVMGAFWFGSLTIYSKVSLMIGDLGPVVAWPLFMALIILTSNFWGWQHKEWTGCHPAVKRNALLSVVILVAAVVVLAYSANLSN